MKSWAKFKREEASSPSQFPGCVILLHHSHSCQPRGGYCECTDTILRVSFQRVRQKDEILLNNANYCCRVWPFIRLCFTLRGSERES